MDAPRTNTSAARTELATTALLHGSDGEEWSRDDRGHGGCPKRPGSAHKNMIVRYTFAESEERKRAQAILDTPDDKFPDLHRAEYHKARAKGVLRRTEEQARKRAAEREAKAAVPPPPSGITVQTWSEERQKVREFLAKVNAHVAEVARTGICTLGCCKGSPVARSAEVVAVKPAPAPRASDVLAGVTSYVICPSCRISTEFCSCTKPQPGVEPFLNALDRADKFIAERKAAEESQR